MKSKHNWPQIDSGSSGFPPSSWSEALSVTFSWCCNHPDVPPPKSANWTLSAISMRTFFGSIASFSAFSLMLLPKIQILYFRYDLFCIHFFIISINQWPMILLLWFSIWREYNHEMATSFSGPWKILQWAW